MAAVANPTFSPVAGTYAGAQSVVISTVTAGATIYYTTDGTTPNIDSSTTSVYSFPISVASSKTLKAYAVKAGSTDSSVVSAAYVLENDYTGRIWRITAAGETPFGSANVKIKGGSWTGGTSGDTFTITDIAGRVYTWTFPSTAEQVTFQELGWLSGPVTFGGTFHGEIDLYLGSK